MYNFDCYHFYLHNFIHYLFFFDRVFTHLFHFKCRPIFLKHSNLNTEEPYFVVSFLIENNKKFHEKAIFNSILLMTILSKTRANYYKSLSSIVPARALWNILVRHNGAKLQLKLNSNFPVIPRFHEIF